jgi:SPP1 family predicted phage head-tail adaptor
MDDVLTLISADSWEIDNVGNQIAATSKREVWARLESVSRAEFAAGGEQNLKPELMAVVCQFDYEGEEEAEYNGKKYRIYRTYAPLDSDRIELYLTRRRSTDGD